MCSLKAANLPLLSSCTYSHSCCPEVPNVRVKYVAHRASCLKINLNGEKDKPDVKSKEVEMVKTEPDIKPKVKTKPNIKPNKERKQDVKPNIKSNKEHKPITGSNREHKSNIEFDKEHKQDVKMTRTEPDTNDITYEEEKIALVLGITSIFTVWWMFK